MQLNELAARKGNDVDYQKLVFDYTRHPDQDAATPVRRPVVVVDQERRPLGVVSSNGVLAALTSDALRPDETAATGRRISPQRSIQPLHRA